MFTGFSEKADSLSSLSQQRVGSLPPAVELLLLLGLISVQGYNVSKNNFAYLYNTLRIKKKNLIISKYALNYSDPCSISIWFYSFWLFFPLKYSLWV